MKSLDFGRHALGGLAAATILAGCGGSQMPVAFYAGTKDATTRVPVENPTYKISDDLLYITNFDPGTPYDDVKIYHAKAKNPSPFAVRSKEKEGSAFDALLMHRASGVAKTLVK